MEVERANPRYAAVELKAVLLDADGEELVAARDISASGICLVSKKRHEVGSLFRVRLWLDFGQQRFSEQFETTFRVVWCTALEEVFQIGATLVDENQQTRRLLATLVHFMVKDVSQEGVELRFLTRH